MQPAADEPGVGHDHPARPQRRRDLDGRQRQRLPHPRAARARLTTSMAGRAAEEILLDGEHTQGAAGDLQAATQLASAMVTQYGMTDFGYAQLDAETLRVGGEVAVLAHREIDGLIRWRTSARSGSWRSIVVCSRPWPAALLEEETLDAGRIREVAEQFGPLPAHPLMPEPRREALPSA